MRSFLRRAFFGRSWDIAYRQITAEAPLPFQPTTGYRLLRATSHFWCADPFCVVRNGRTYVFVEMMRMWRGIGSIGVFEINPDGSSALTEVIREKFHLSYPNVFEWDGQMYMVPESSRARKLLLYKAADFPTRWTLETVLLDNVELVDNSLLICGGNRYLFSYCKGHPERSPVVFELHETTIHPLGRLENARSNQGAGNVLAVDGERYRPVQDSTNFYGERILVQHVRGVPGEQYSEEFSGAIGPENIMAAEATNRYDAIHTINRWGNIEVVDLGYTRRYPIKPLQVVSRWIVRIYSRFIRSGGQRSCQCVR